MKKGIACQGGLATKSGLFLEHNTHYLAFIGGPRTISPHQAIVRGKMSKQLERQIRKLQKELATVRKDQAALRLHPCKGDSEIRQKDRKLDHKLEGIAYLGFLIL